VSLILCCIDQQNHATATTTSATFQFLFDLSILPDSLQDRLDSAKYELLKSAASGRFTKQTKSIKETKSNMS